jgi:hypothetical protein
MLETERSKRAKELGMAADKTQALNEVLDAHVVVSFFFFFFFLI